MKDTTESLFLVMQNSIYIAVCTVVLLACLAGNAEPADQQIQLSATMNVLPADLSTRQLGANWASYNGDYSGKRFSSLSQIDTSNVRQLQAQWVFHTNNSDRMEVTPLVVNGVMFVTAGNETYSLDASTGVKSGATCGLTRMG
jgi:alcohol dehydrogenase (cytochrome c)